MSKITNDGLTRSGAGCFIAEPIWQQWASSRQRVNFSTFTGLLLKMYIDECFVVVCSEMVLRPR